jgi:hypothetical protein
MPGKIPSQARKRSYPPFWEKFIPFALVIISLIIACLIYMIFRVALGLTPLPF